VDDSTPERPDDSTPERPDDRRDAELPDSAPRRTYLAAERTYLAWLRTGLGALGLSLAVGRLIPALIDSSHVAFAVLGIGYGLLGALLVVYAAWRQRSVRRALVTDAPLPFDGWIVTVLTVATIVLAAATLVLVLVEI
jgi:putative membrane protein